MANARVQRIELLLHSSVRDDLLEALADAGAVELEPLEPEARGELPAPSAGPAEEADRALGQIRQALDYLDAFAPKAGFLAGMMGHKVEVPAAELEGRLAGFDAQAAAGEVLTVQSRETEARSRLDRLVDERATLASWLGLEVPPDSLGATDSTFSAAYALNPRNLPRLRDALAEAAGELFELSDLGVAGEEASAASGRIVLVWHASVDSGVRDALKGFELVPCPLTGPLTPARRLEEVEGEIEGCRGELEEVHREARRLLAHRDPLYLALDRARTESEGQRRVAESAATELTIYMRGWVPEAAVDGVKRILDGRELVHYTLREPTEDETPPVYLANIAPVRPFEMVTDLYGRPQPAESDPTPFFAFFFALFFGICLTDAGYGLVLIVTSLLFLKLLHLGPTMRKLFRMMIVAGVFTMIVGVLTGGFFGLSVELSPELARVRESLMVLDPLDPDQMFYFFYFSLGLGYLHLFIGYTIGFFEALKQKDRQTAFFRKLPWILVMLLVPAAVGLPMLGVSGEWAWYAVIAVGLYVVAFSGVGDDSGLPRLGAGFFNLYTGFSGLFSDILSYARLFALGLATAVIAQVVNTMAFDSNIIGMILILIVGHAFNIAINSLGGFIHTARLQFVEYFGKFYTGGGRTFVPYARSMEHTVLKG
jgi:V/A-type H+-transporting ATPase subunit I